MIYTHKQCLKEKGSAYHVQKAVQSGELYQIEKGIYADTENVTTLGIITTKYPEAIITLDILARDMFETFVCGTESGSR